MSKYLYLWVSDFFSNSQYYRAKPSFTAPLNRRLLRMMPINATKLEVFEADVPSLKDRNYHAL